MDEGVQFMKMIHVTKTPDGSYFIVDATSEVANLTATFAPTTGASTEEGCRTGLKNLGVPENVIDQAIQKANEKTDAMIQLDAGRWHLA
jgi:hypothetical protein